MAGTEGEDKLTEFLSCLYPSTGARPARDEFRAERFTEQGAKWPAMHVARAPDPIYRR